MKIHRFESTDTLDKIAEKYGTTGEMLCIYNDIHGDMPAVGEELIILTPTRTYKASVNDTLERISLRFSIKKNKLIAINPGVGEGALPLGREIALKFSDACYGTALANGYFYTGCTEERLSAVLPYLTYVTFSVAKYENGEITLSKFSKSALDTVIINGKIPLVRIYEQNKLEKFNSPDSFIDKCIKTALDMGFKGITLNLEDEKDSNRASEFLIKMRKRLIGSDLILITELNDNSSYDFADYSDGSVICYPKLSMEKPKSFKLGEEAVFSDFATKSESAKTFIDLPCLARCNDGFYDLYSVLKKARSTQGEILHDDESMLARAKIKGEEYVFAPPRNIKAILDTVYEYGYMGISFDIMRIPMPYLYMYGASFSTMAYNGIMKHGRCNMDG